MKQVILITVLAALVAAPAAMSDRASGRSAATLTVHSSRYGRILFDGRGFALYAFTRDPRGRSVCTGACAKAWPPYTVKGALRAAAGVKSGLIGTIRRANGSRQVTYAGRPVYYYVGDTKAGQILCQNVREFGGLWLVVRPDGRLVR
jgi:predicted lipoprotein with Yx(FWY)xxD motif